MQSCFDLPYLGEHCLEHGSNQALDNATSSSEAPMEMHPFQEGQYDPAIHCETLHPSHEPIRIRCRAVLTAEQAAEIYQYQKTANNRFPFDENLTGRTHAVAKKYNVSPKTVRDIWSRRSWVNETRHLWTEEDQPLRRIHRKRGTTRPANSDGTRARRAHRHDGLSETDIDPHQIECMNCNINSMTFENFNVQHAQRVAQGFDLPMCDLYQSDGNFDFSTACAAFRDAPKAKSRVLNSNNTMKTNYYCEMPPAIPSHDSGSYFSNPEAMNAITSMIHSRPEIASLIQSRPDIASLIQSHPVVSNNQSRPEIPAFHDPFHSDWPYW